MGLSVEMLIYRTGLPAVLAVWGLVREQGVVGAVLIAFSIADVGLILFLAFRRLSPVERGRLLSAMFLISLGPLFWALFEQAGPSHNLYTDRAVDRTVAGVEVPASVFQSVNSTFIILLAPVFAGLWTLLADRKSEPSAPFKFRIGLILVGTGFLVLVLGATLSGGAATPALFVILLYLFHTAAELCFSPVGLAAMTRLSAASMTGLMMGTWFLSTAAGNFLAGVIAQSTESGSAGPGGVISTYAKLGWGAVAVGLLVFVVARPVTRLMRLDLFESDDQPVRH